MVALRKESVDRNIPSHWIMSRMGGVALRKESVDRNRSAIKCAICRIKSLSARRAWIEIGPAFLIRTLVLSLSARRAWIEIILSR